jgi:hypothetical protein
MDDLDQTLNKFQVPLPEQQEVVAMIESIRNDIVVAV